METGFRQGRPCPTSCGRTRRRPSLDLGHERQRPDGRRARQRQSRAELAHDRDRRFQRRRPFRRSCCRTPLPARPRSGRWSRTTSSAAARSLPIRGLPGRRLEPGISTRTALRHPVAEHEHWPGLDLGDARKQPVQRRTCHHQSWAGLAGDRHRRFQPGRLCRHPVSNKSTGQVSVWEMEGTSLKDGAPAVNKPRTLRGIVEADETFILESFKGRWSDLSREPRKRGGTAGARDYIRTPFPFSSPATGRARPSMRPAPGRQRFGEGRPGRRRHAGQSSHRRRRQGDRGFRPPSRDTVPCRALPGEAGPRGPASAYQQRQRLHSRLKQWLGRFNGVATKNLPQLSGWRRALEAWSDKLDPPNWIKGAIGNGPYQQITL